MHPCDREGKAGCEQTCSKKGDETVCECGVGFILNKDGKKCDKVHPCDRKDMKACEQVCNKNGDKAECSCNKDFKLKEDGTSCEEGESK